MVLRWARNRRQAARPQSRRAAPRGWQGFRPSVEALERRELLANTPSFAPLIPWVAQGPSPIQGGQVEGLGAQNNPVAGAIASVAVDPSDPNHIVVGTVNGGIWVTTNGTQASPTWTPASDHLRSLAISSVAFDPTGIPGRGVWAGTGNLSNSGLAGASMAPGAVGDGGGNAGLYRSFDGGQTWFQAGNTANQFRNFRVREVLPTGQVSGSTEIILAALLDGGGLWRSTDGGATFTQISGASGSGLSAGSITSLTQDPGTPARIYAAIPGQGVFISADTGATWNPANGAGPTGLPNIGVATRIETVVSAGAGNPIYAAVIVGGGLNGIYRSNNQGATWTAMDLPGTTEVVAGVPRFFGLITAGKGNLDFSMVPDPIDPNVIYVGGDQQPGGGGANQPNFPNSEQLNTFSGRHFRGDSSLAPGTQWNFIDGTGANGSNNGATGTSVHSGSRDMVFDPNGNILEVDEGGIYRLTQPSLPANRVWSSVNGNLSVAELTSTAYDDVSHTVFGGTVTTGFAEQTSQNAAAWTEQTYWQGQGSVAGVDNTSGAGTSIHYGSLAFLTNFHRRTFNSLGQVILDKAVGLQVIGQAGKTLQQFDPLTRADTPYVINTVDPTRMLIATTRLYESADQGDTLSNLGQVGNGTLLGPMAYGGTLAGVANPDVAYVAAGTRLFLRTRSPSLGGTFAATNYFGGTVQSIALDPNDWRHAFVLDTNANLWRTYDGGVTWDNALSGNLAQTLFFSAGKIDVRSLTLYSPTNQPDDEALFVGAAGGVFTIDVPQSISTNTDNWFRFDSYGANAPSFPNVTVTSLTYDSKTDTLVAGTLGRGAWTVSNLSNDIWDNDISGTKFEDINGNQVQDGLEPGVLGVTIFLDTNNSGTFDPGEVSTTTDGAGGYIFPNLAPGTYKVREVLPNGYVPSTPLLPDITVTHSLHANQHGDLSNPLDLVVPTDIGNFRAFSISGQVFNDINGDGIKNGADFGLQNWTLNLLFFPLAGGGPQIAQTTVSQAGGVFTFNNIGPSFQGVRGTYQVSEVVKAGFFETTPDPTPTPKITAVSGGNVGGLLFGNFQQISVTGVVYNDVNGDGTKQAGDLGIANVTVFIDKNNNGVPDGTDPVTTTNNFGVYSFTLQGPGLLHVRVVLPAGDVQTTPLLDINSQSGVNIGSPASDIGLFKRFTISGRVYQDLNGNGVDDNEPGLSNWTLNLLRNGNQFATTATDGTGAYSFPNLGPGTYTVQVVVQTGFVQDTPTPVVPGTSGGDTVAKIGIFKSYTVTGTVYQDVNANGQLDSGEPPLFNWTVFLDTNDNGVLDPGERSTASDAQGHYTITDIGPGTYNVRQVLKFSDWKQTGPIPAPPGKYVLTASFGGTAANTDFGDFHQVNITGTVFSDLNANGVQDANDLGFGGATVVLSLASGGTFNQVATATTDVNGNYSFSQFQPGTYQVRLQPQPTFTQTTSDPPDIVAQSGTFNPGINFGIFVYGTISGTVFNDVNGNGQLDTGDAGVQNIPVQLTGGATPLSTTTDVNGNYSFSGLTGGTYTLSETAPSGTVITTKPGPVTVQSGTAATGRNFGNFQPVTVTGTLFQDLNANGTREGGEGPLSGFFVFADTNNNGVQDPGDVVSTSPSDANGNFTLTGVGTGSYSIRIVPQNNWFQTTTAPTVTTTSGGTLSGLVIGAFHQFTISGTVFNDLNNTGQLAAGDPGVANVRVYVDSNGNGAFDPGEVSAFSAADGTYQLNGLTFGTYAVRAVPPQRATQTTATPPDQTGSFGGTASGINFGFVLPISISGRVVNDLNGDGIPAPEDPGLGGWTVFLDANGNGVLDPGELSTQTEPSFGGYAFQDVPPGTYAVTEILPSGWTARLVGVFYDPQGNPTDIPVSNPVSVNPHTTVQAVSGSRAVVLFTNFQTAVIAGTVYWDLNRNSVRDANEPGLAGWTVFLDLNNDGTPNPAEPSAVTNAGGGYAFTGLSAGTFVVREIAPAGWVQTTLTPVIAAKSGTNATSTDVGNFLSNSITGRVFVDTNGDGNPVGKPALAGWTVFLDSDGNGLLDPGEPSTTSDANGNYVFANLGPGDYRVREVQPAGWNTTVAPPGTLTLTSGNNLANADFGNFQFATLSGHAFRDVNSNGVQDPNEPNLAGAIIELDAGSSGNVIGTIATDGAGNFAFRNVAPGTFVVSQRRLAGVRQTVPSSGSYALTAASGASVGGLVFGTNTIDLIAVGADAGGGPNVIVYNAATGAVRFNFFAYDPRFTGGVRVAVGDVSGDGVPDVITAPGPGGGPDIHVYDGTNGALIRSFFAFNPAFTGGAYVASGDINVDGFSDIVLGADAGGGPNVTVFSGQTNAMLQSFFAYNPAFTGGVRVAVGDVNGDGNPDLICGAGPGGGPNVTIFDGRNDVMLNSFFGYDPRFTAGIFVAAGDVNGDGRADVVFGAGVGGGSDVRVSDGLTGAPLAAFLAYPPAPSSGLISLNPAAQNPVWSSGVRVGTAVVNGGRLAIITGPGRGRAAPIAEFDALTGTQLDAFFAYDPAYAAGVFIGGGHG